MAKAQRNEDVLDNTIVIELLQQTNLANSRAGHTFVLCLQPDLLECYDLVARHIAGFVYNTVCSYVINATVNGFCWVLRGAANSPSPMRKRTYNGLSDSQLDLAAGLTHQLSQFLRS